MGNKGRPRTKTTWRARTIEELDVSTRILLADCKAANDDALAKRVEWKAAQRRLVDLAYACRSAGVSNPLLSRYLGREERTVTKWTQDLHMPNPYLTDD